MVGFLKKFKTMIPEMVQLIILGAIGVYALIRGLDGKSAILDFLGAFLPLSLLLLAVFLLALKRKMLASHLVMLLALFDSGPRNLIATLFSYNFATEKWDKFDIQLLLAAAAGVYLFMIVISYALDNKESIKLNFKSVMYPFFVFSIFGYLCYGLETTLMILLTSAIVVAFGSNLGGMSILLATVILQPLALIFRIDNKILKFTDVFDWIIYLGSFYVIYILVLAAIKEYKADPIKLNIPVEPKEEPKE